MTGIAARLLRTFNGAGNVAIYETLAAPPADDGAIGDYAICLGGGTLAAFGPKTSASGWPALALNSGPDGPAGPGVGRPAPDTAGRFTLPDHITSTQSNGAITAGRLSTTPLHIGPAGLTANGLAMVLGSTPQAGGAATATTAIYADDGTDGCTPDWATGPLATATMTLTGSAGNVVTGITLDMDPGTYHLAFLYVVTDATGHTQPTVTLANGANSRFAGASPAAQVRGFTADSITSMPTGTGPALTASAVNLPIVAVRNA